MSLSVKTIKTKLKNIYLFITVIVLLLSLNILLILISFPKFILTIQIFTILISLSIIYVLIFYNHYYKYFRYYTVDRNNYIIANISSEFLDGNKNFKALDTKLKWHNILRFKRINTDRVTEFKINEEIFNNIDLENPYLPKEIIEDNKSVSLTLLAKDNLSIVEKNNKFYLCDIEHLHFTQDIKNNYLTEIKGYLIVFLLLQLIKIGAVILTLSFYREDNLELFYNLRLLNIIPDLMGIILIIFMRDKARS